MNDAFKKELREKLETELAEVEAELRTVGRINPKNPADWEAVPDKLDIMTADQNEVADSIESYEENTAILKQLEIRFNELKRAQNAMTTASYGICRICNKPISEDRLRANPAASTCTEHRDVK